MVFDMDIIQVYIDSNIYEITVQHFIRTLEIVLVFTKNNK